MNPFTIYGFTDLRIYGFTDLRIYGLNDTMKFVNS